MSSMNDNVDNNWLCTIRSLCGKSPEILHGDSQCFPNRIRWWRSSMHNIFLPIASLCPHQTSNARTVFGNELGPDNFKLHVGRLNAFRR